jgi:oxygen-independent coproporphyrinogen-3 oxidase
VVHAGAGDSGSVQGRRSIAEGRPTGAAGYPGGVMDDGCVGVYLHVPFCARVCPYCDFAVVRAPRGPGPLEAPYVDALLAELARRAPDFVRRPPGPAAPAVGASASPGAPRPGVSIYLGGGTPSLLDPSSVARLVEAVRAHFPTPPDAAPEVTLELNPGTTERGRLPGFRAAGVNRLSVGVQSFDDRVLKRLGRAHRADEARATLAAARSAGFENVSVDLIVAAPGQRSADLERDLEELLAFAPQHVSAYSLTIEAGTPFERAARRGQLDLPDEDEAAALLERLAERLEAAGLARYELSSFARPGRESRHNRRYWQRRPVLGLGVGAWSCEPPGPDAPFGARRANVRDLATYLARIAAGEPADAAPAERLAADTARGEAAFLALRTRAGLAAERFAEEFGAPPRAFWGPAIDELREAGLLVEADGGDLRLSRRGLLLADSVFACFV